MLNKPYSESCDQNREVILDQLRRIFSDQSRLLEIGSGTGQHAAWMPQFLAHLHWQPSDVAANLPGIRLWLADGESENVSEPVELDVGMPTWPSVACDCVFSANTAHIMSQALVDRMFAEIGSLLPSGGRFALYGPFNYNGRFSSESNARFDQWLKSRDPLSGVRDFEHLNEQASRAGMRLLEDIEMPANNRILLWEKG